MRTYRETLDSRISRLEKNQRELISLMGVPADRSTGAEGSGVRGKLDEIHDALREIRTAGDRYRRLAALIGAMAGGIATIIGAAATLN